MRKIVFTSKKDRFDSKWIPEPFSGCWLWTGTPSGNGYGMSYWQKHGDYAHRESWRIHHGEIPQGMFVLHYCDTPACVNPNHLFLGTQKDNRRDCCNKGRHVVGEAHYRAKFTEDQIREIRSSPLGCRRLAREYSCAYGTITKIKRRMRWRHVT